MIILKKNEIHTDVFKKIINFFCLNKMKKSYFKCYFFSFRDRCKENKDCKKFKFYLKQSKCSFNRRHTAYFIIKTFLYKIQCQK